MKYDKDRQGNKIINVDTSLKSDVGELLQKNTQEVPQSFLDDLKHQRNESTKKREGNFMRVASIPTVVIEKWRREGFDIYSDKNITGQEIVKRLKSENLDAFLTTDKRI